MHTASKTDKAFECVVVEIINWFHNGYKDQVVDRHKVTGESKYELFKRVYAFDRSARYDNARRYEIEDPSLRSEYKEWKKHGVTMEMFYGGGTVD